MTINMILKSSFHQANKLPSPSGPPLSTNKNHTERLHLSQYHSHYRQTCHGQDRSCNAHNFFNPQPQENRVISAHIQRVHIFCRFQLIFVPTAAVSCQQQQLRSPTDSACQLHKHISTDSFVCANKMISSLHSAYSSTLKTSSV